MKLFLFTALCALTHSQVFGQDDYCFGKDNEREQTRQFATKTAYQIVKGANMDKQYEVPNCVPQKIWIYHRHGTRLPEKEVIENAPRLEQLRDEIVKNYRVRKTKPSTNALCQEDLFALQMWKWNSSITVDQAQYLTSQGYEDLKGTAKLYQKYYPEVLSRDYNREAYLFAHTDKQRTTESFKAFAEGLFGENNGAEAQPRPEKDYLLRPYDFCSNTANAKGEGSEQYKFRHSEQWNTTLKDISTRLGFQYAMAEEDIMLMFNMCRFDQAWQVDRTSAWCAAFTPDQVTVFEYSEDLYYYYKGGYGHDRNKDVNCRAVKDMLTHLDSKEAPQTVAYFAHSEGLQTLITALGINKDNVHLKADNFNSLRDRRWKTSLIDPFAANFMAVKYQCDNDIVNREKVIFFLNQNGVDLDWCKVGLCNWSEVKKRYANFIDADCDSYYCRSAATATVGATLISVLLAAIVYLIY